MREGVENEKTTVNVSDTLKSEKMVEVLCKPSEDSHSRIGTAGS